MDLYLLRHAIAEDRTTWQKEGESDPSRPLTSKGINRFLAALPGILLVTGSNVEILTSPYARADQTAQLLRETSGEELVIRRSNALVPGGKRSRVLNQVQKCSAESILLVGHEPDLTELACYLLSEESQPGWERIKKGGLVKISFRGKPVAGAGKLLCYLAPRALRELSRVAEDSIQPTSAAA